MHISAVQLHVKETKKMRVVISGAAVLT